MTGSCSEVGCAANVLARGLCSRHYQAWYKAQRLLRHPCSVDGCEDQVIAKGYCSRHYQRWQAHGTPHHEHITPLAERLWRRVRKTDGCWFWTGCRDKNGYGQIALKRGEHSKLVHRISWQLTYGVIPDGLNVLHKCDTPTCCNPDHLFLGTQLDNMRDMRAKGRGRRPMLTPTILAKARKMLAKGAYQRDVAHHFNVSQSGLSRALKREP